MLQANVLIGETPTNSIQLLLYEDVELKQAHFADNYSSIIQLLNTYDVSSIKVGIIGDSKPNISIVENLIEEMLDENIEIESIDAYDSMLDYESSQVGRTQLNTMLDEEMGEYVIVVDEANSAGLTNELLLNGYIVSWEKLENNIQIRVHGSIYED